MSSKRDMITSLREKLRERTADSTYTNQFLYSVLLENAKWLIRREINAGRIYGNSVFFQSLKCIPVMEVSTIDECCPVKGCASIYRTNEKLPDMWVDEDGPVIKTVTSIDGTTEFFRTNDQTWQSKSVDPYQTQMPKLKYTFFKDGYLWFPEWNPRFVNLYAFFMDDTANLSMCDDKTKLCIRFLDTLFMLPPWLEAEMFAKALQQLAGITKKFAEDEQIDKNPNDN